MQSQRVSYSSVMHLAWPVILSNLSVPLLGAVDTAVIGHLPDPAYLGAVAIGSMIFSFLYWGFGFLRMGTTGFIAQAYGGRDYDEVNVTFLRALMLGLVLATFILILQYPVFQVASGLVEMTDAVRSNAEDYFFIRIFGAPAALANYCILGTFIGLGKTKLALVTQIFMNGMNIFLDVLFVVGFDMGVFGVGLATAISETAAVILGLFLLVRHFRRLGGNWNYRQIWITSKIIQLLAVNRDIFIRTILLISAFAYFTATASKVGEETLAATAVAMNFMHFMSFGLDGFAHAAESLVGKAVGAKNEQTLRDTVKTTTVLAVIVSALYSLVYWVFGVGIIDLLTTIEGVRLNAYEFLPWLVVMPLAAVWSFQLDGIFVGAVRAKEMRNGMVISFVIYITCIQFLPEIYGADGLWMSMFIFMLARGLTLFAVYPRITAEVRANSLA